jgi:hypothetical protein
MARVRERRIFWTLPPAAKSAIVYVGDPSDSSFLANADSGVGEVIAQVPATEPQELILKQGMLADGNYQFTVVAADEEAGKFADPYQHPAWVDVPLDLSPLPPASDGGLELL